MDLKFIHRGVGGVVTGESGYQVFGSTQLYQVGQVVGMQMELYVKTLTLSRCTEGCGKSRALPQHSKPTRPHAQQDISKEAFKGYCRAIKIAFHLTLPRESTPPTTFDFILPLLKSVVIFFVACSVVHDSISIQGSELQKEQFQ